jgi:hypothetical protein
MNKSPKYYTSLARQMLYRLLSNLPLDGSEATKDMEMLCTHAISQTGIADNVLDKYYFDVRDLSGWIAAERGHEELAKWTEMYNEYRRKK